MKKAVALLLVFTMLFVDFAYGIANGIDFGITANAASSGTCGDNVTWTLDDEGTLTISGTGKMYDYELMEAPWYSYQSSIKAVNICEGITSISNGAFFDCYAVASLFIPSSVADIGDYAFIQCASLESIDVSPDNQHFTSDDGVLMNLNKTELIAYPAGKKDTAYEIPSTVVAIDAYAFSDCYAITRLTIPSSVVIIGQAAFNTCIFLTDVSMPSSVRSIGKSAFYKCWALTGITIPSGVVDIDDGTFGYCKAPKIYQYRRA